MVVQVGVFVFDVKELDFFEVEQVVIEFELCVYLVFEYVMGQVIEVIEFDVVGVGFGDLVEFIVVWIGIVILIDEIDQ